MSLTERRRDNRKKNRQQNVVDVVVLKMSFVTIMWMRNVYFWAFKHFYLVFILNVVYFPSSSHFFRFSISLSTFEEQIVAHIEGPQDHTFRFIRNKQIFIWWEEATLFVRFFLSFISFFCFFSHWYDIINNTLCIICYFLNFIVLPMSRFTP